MASLVVANAAQVTLRWQNGQLPMVNVLGMNIGASGTIAGDDANVVASVVTQAYGTSGLAAYLDTSTSLTGVSIRDIRAEGLPDWPATVFTPLVGTAPGERVSVAAAAVVTLRTAKAGRRFRGRTYLGGFNSAAIDDETGLILTAAYTAAVAFIEGIRTGLAGQPAQPFALGVVSRPNPDRLPVPWPGEVNTVTAVVGRSAIVGTQRRRLPDRP